MRKINHRDLELEIGRPCRCDDYLQLKVAGFYSTNNKVVIAARQGIDEFFLAARGPKTDLSDAILLESRYLVIGSIADIDRDIYNSFSLKKQGGWMEMPDDFFKSRLLIAGAAKIIAVTNALTPRLTQTPEYKQAVADRRLIELVCGE